MQKLFHVFLSSTYTDLIEERQVVRDAIAKAGHVCEGMELFPASSQKQLDFIKRVIDRCDYYVVIVGGRYGSLADNDVSYTEQEYEYAVSKGIPVLAFVHKNPASIAVAKADTDPQSLAKLGAFRTRLLASAMADFWEVPAALATSVVVSLGQEINLMPGVGWVRGDNAIDPKILEDLAKSKQRIAELEKELASASSDELSFPKNLQDIHATVSFSVEVQIQTRVANSNVPAVEKQTAEVSTTWHDAFLSVGEELFLSRFERILVNEIVARAYKASAEPAPEEQKRIISAKDATTLFRYQFEALGLIQAEISSNGVQRGMVWHLTTKGRQYLSRSLAVKAVGN